jgi:hypothetical protein
MKKLLLTGVTALSVLCTSGAHADEGHRNVWQCANVRVTYLPKKLSPDDWFPTDYEYIVTGIPLTCLKIDGTMEPCESRQIPLPRPRPAEAPEPVPVKSEPCWINEFGVQ